MMRGALGLVVALLGTAGLVGMVVGCSKDAPQPASSQSASPPGADPPAAAVHPAGTGRVNGPQDGWTVAKAAAGGGAAPAAAGKRPSFANYNVILLSIDSWRADMPWTGYPRAIAPRLAEVEKRAVVFDKAYSVSSYTSM